MLSDRTLGGLGLVVAAVMVTGLAFPFWQDVSVWEFHTQVPWAMPVIIGGLSVIVGSAIAALWGRNHRVTGAAMAISSLAIVLQVLYDFLPLPIFDESPSGVIEALFTDGAVGAKVLFIAGVVGVLVGLLGMLRRGRRES